MSDGNKILILFAHPSQRRSEINVPLFKAASNIDGITAVDLYFDYPTFRIDIEREQKRLRAHDVIIFMFPLYWYSTPAILKEWQDLVLEYGFAYGSDGDALRGKTFFCALTAGGGEEAYRREGINHFSIRELLEPLEQTAYLTGMDYVAPFVLFGSRTAAEEGRLEQHLKDWKLLLYAIRDDQIDLERAAKLSILNSAVDQLNQEF